MNSQLRLQSKMIFIQFLISIPQYPALQPQADTVKENKRIDTQHVTTPDKISDISHTSTIVRVYNYTRGATEELE